MTARGARCGLVALVLCTALAGVAAPRAAVANSAPLDDAEGDGDEEYTTSQARAIGAVSFGRALDLQGSPLRIVQKAGRPSAGGLARVGTRTATGRAGPYGLPLRYTSVSSGFGWRQHPLLGGVRFHAGVDLAAASGTPIAATAPGVVMTAGWAGGYGLCVTIDHQNGYVTIYGHLSHIAVASGQPVQFGQNLGQVGSTGLSTGPHLHYEVRYDGRPVSPY